MKKLFTLTVIIGLTLVAYGQAPQKMSYQCVVRNSAGALVASHAVGLKISILKGSATGTVVFSETYSPVPQTNANGLLTVEIGGGTATVGTFAGIDWSAGPYFLKTETDPAGGTDYTITGTSQLLSVPYALYAKTAANGFSGAWSDISGKPSFATVATSGSYNDLLNKPSMFSGSYNDLTNKPVLFDGTWTSLTGKPVLFDGTWTSLSGKPAGFADGTDNVDDADNSVTNEIQALSISGTVLSLSLGGGSVTLPSSGGGDNWGTQTVVTNTTLTGFGTTASPLAVANTVITPSWARIQGIPAGFADGTDNIDDADNSITNEIQTLNLSGTTLTLSSGGGSVTLPSSGGGDNWGTQVVVTDVSLAGNGTTATPLMIPDNGVTAAKIASGAVTTAKILDGTVSNADLADNSVTSAKIASAAVTGNKIAQAGATAGQVLKWNGTTSVWAPATDETGSGETTWQISGSNIYRMTGNVGIGIDAPQYPLHVRSSTYGVYSVTTGSAARSLVGEATGTASIGVRGIATNTSSTGVWGEGANQGVYGTSSLATGKGVFGHVDASTGFSGYFDGGKFYVDGMVGIGTESPTAWIHAKGTGPGEGTVLFEGSRRPTSPGDLPVRASDCQLMWYPDKAAFMAGHILNWHKDSIGIYSVAFGVDVKASGDYASAFGHSSTACGDYSLAAGWSSYASGESSVALGSFSSAHGQDAFAFGGSAQANGENSISIGMATEATGINSIAMGRNAKAVGDYSFAIHLYHTAAPDVGNRTFYISGASGIGGNLGWSNWSDKRLKKDIMNLSAENNIAKIVQLDGVRFRWKDNDTRLNLGFIAQDVKDIIPECVIYDELNDIYSIEYTMIIPVLVEAFKEQQKQIQDQQKDIDELKALVNSLVLNK